MHSQLIEMVEGCMLCWILVDSEWRLGIYVIQSLELGAGIRIVCFVFLLGPCVLVRVWFTTPDAQRPSIVWHVKRVN